MNYEEEIKGLLLNSSKWPSYSRPDVLSNLDAMADDALSVSNLSERDCIASILILQQLTEELVKVQVKMAQFIIQARMLPIEIRFNEKKGKMFGQIIKDLTSSIEFPNKAKIIELANSINKERIEIAHGLIMHSENKDYVSSAIKVRNEFEEFYHLQSEADDWMRLILKDIKKEIFAE